MKYLPIILMTLTPILAHANTITEAEANIVDEKNKVIGQAQFFQGNEGVVVKFNVRGLKPGLHGVHFHEVGDCSDFNSGFKKAGDHIHDADKEEHGFLSEDGPHPADLPNIYFHRDGTGIAEFFTQRISLDGQDFKKELLDSDGSSIIIHESEDDYYTQPSGNSGKRVACGVLKGK